MEDLSNENIVHIKKGGIEYLQFRKLLEYPEIKHAITLKPLNFFSNIQYEKNKKEVIENYKKLCDCLELDYHCLIRPNQTHTDCIKSVTQKDLGILPDSLNEVDGLITNQRNLILSLVFADCIPLLFFDPVQKVIANIHSGWKGTVKQIGKKAVQTMIKKYHCHPKDILCCIGPSIANCHFEVNEDVYQIFRDTYENRKEIDKIIQKAETKEGNQKYHIDTVYINQLLLEDVGLLPEHIIESHICTVCHCNLTHSYRVDKEFAGRATAIEVLI